VGAFAEEAVRVLGMGQDEVTDYLGLSFSQTDAVGHAYGPLSQEQLENLLHLDRLLGDLMVFLDEVVGEGRWLMALTGDHGALDVPEYLAEQGQDARRATREDFSVLRGLFAQYQDLEGDPLDVADALVAALEELPFIADALTVAELTGGPPADSFVTLMRNSYHPDRWIGGVGSQGSGVIFRYVERFYPSTDPRGSGHGTPYYYDRHVPLIFFGTGVEPGVSGAPARTVDIAPTLAWLAGIPWPTDVDGVLLLQ
jgi:arylsulfatase A-like enzyme